MTYEEQLKDSRWIAKRNEIKKRDNNECKMCASKKQLQVHHSKYKFGSLAWEYDNRYLITVCESCHKLFHGKVKPAKIEVEINKFKYSENDIRHLMNNLSAPQPKPKTYKYVKPWKRKKKQNKKTKPIVEPIVDNTIYL
jgi:5-methylcytosine-specific restriction endonuclease McrA